jgi:hypothetical protein
MSDEKPSLHIDTDWKRQAQEEKKRLAEEAERKRPQAATPPPGAGAGMGMGAAAAAVPGAAASAGAATASRASSATAGRERGALPPPAFSTLVQSLVTQILFYLGELAPRGTEPQLNLDMAKHNIDMLGVLEEKTKGNLTPEEQRLLDGALYETRMRYVSVATQYAVV